MNSCKSSFTGGACRPVLIGMLLSEAVRYSCFRSVCLGQVRLAQVLPTQLCPAQDHPFQVRLTLGVAACNHPGSCSQSSPNLDQINCDWNDAPNRINGDSDHIR